MADGDFDPSKTLDITMHREGTLSVVSEALKELGFAEQRIETIVSALQNAGILFREAPDDIDDGYARLEGDKVGMSRDLRIMSYRGQEYLKPCGALSGCVLPVGHTSDHISAKEAFSTGFEGSDDQKSEEVPEDGRPESNWARHARLEMRLQGEDPEVIEWMVKVLEAWASFGHSGGSHFELRSVLWKLLEFENLTDLTDDPDEWIEHPADRWDGVSPIYQNKRNPKILSKDRISGWNVDAPSTRVTIVHKTGR